MIAEDGIPGVPPAENDGPGNEAYLAMREALARVTAEERGR